MSYGTCQVTLLSIPGGRQGWLGLAVPKQLGFHQGQEEPSPTKAKSQLASSWAPSVHALSSEGKHVFVSGHGFVVDSHETSGNKIRQAEMARMHAASAQIGPIVMFGLLSVLRALRGSTGNGIHLVPPWLPPTMNSLKRVFLWKRLLQPSVSSPCFIVSLSSAADILLPLPWQSTRFILSLCVFARLGV